MNNYISTDTTYQYYHNTTNTATVTSYPWVYTTEPDPLWSDFSDPLFDKYDLEMLEAVDKWMRFFQT